MQRQDRPQFFSTPQRITADTESIELVSSQQIVNENNETLHASRRCYTTEYGCMPCESVCEEVRDEIADTNEPFMVMEDCLPVCGDLATIYCAAPIAFVVAGVITPFAFFGGAARDAYEAIKRQCRTSPEIDTLETETRPSI